MRYGGAEKRRGFQDTRQVPDFASLLNAALDLVFIGLLGFGIVCSAVTTVWSRKACQPP